MYNHNSRLKEIMIQFGMLCGELQISDFANCMEDFVVFLQSSTPIVKSFLKDCFNSNTFCEEMDNIEWPVNQKVLVRC